MTPEATDEIVREGPRTPLAARRTVRGCGLGGLDPRRWVGANLLPVLSDPTDLDGIERFIPIDEGRLGEARDRRDEALAVNFGEESTKPGELMLHGPGACSDACNVSSSNLKGTPWILDGYFRNIRGA